MDPRSAYRLQVMEKLGGPLLASLPSGMDAEKSAETVAALVAKSVQAGLALGNAMKLTDTDGDIDSIRLSLAAIAAPLLAQSYKDTGRLPDDAMVEQLVKGLEAALVFSENFTPAQEHTARLKSLHNPLPVIDTTQIAMLSLNALAPIVVSLQQFSFGQSAPALVKDVGERLQNTAKGLADAIAAQGGAGDKSFAQLLVLRALAELFAAAHKHVTGAHQGDAAPSIDAVYAAFDEQVAMMYALSGAAVPGMATAMNAAPVASPPPAAQLQQTAPAQAPATGGSPMGFFKKGGDAPAATAPAPDVAPAQTHQEEGGSGETSSSSGSSSGGGPMSFFKKGN